MLASVIQRQLPIGSRVAFLRKDGRKINGVLSEIGRDHITVEDNQRYVTVLLGEITGWEITPNDNGARIAADTQTIPSSESKSVILAEKYYDDRHISNIIIEVQARFRAKLETAAIQVAHLDFANELPAGHDAATATTWNRIRNRYQYAVKVNELGRKFGRVQPIIHDLESIVNRYPDSPIVHSHLAYIYALFGDERARTHYQRAAIISDERLDWFNLAATSLSDDTELACYGLHRYFLLTEATDNLSAWYLYVRLVQKCSAYINLSEYLRVRPRKITDPEARLLVETGIFLLKTAGEDQATVHLTSRWLTGDRPTDLALQAFQQVDTTPSEQYQRIAKRLDTSVATQQRLANTVPGEPSIEADLKSDYRDKTRGNQRNINPISQLRDYSPRRWEQHYRDAALANTEGRIDDARELFQRAIRDGGGYQVYEAYFKMERGRPSLARSIIRRAVEAFPDTVEGFVLYGHFERRIGKYESATEVFRKGIARHPENVMLRMGLAQTLVQIGTKSSVQEAGHIFSALDTEGKLHKHDMLYQRFMILRRNSRVNGALEFFQAAAMRTRLVRQRDLPPNITDIVVDVERAELTESFGLSGSFLVRCFQSNPRPVHLKYLTEYLRSIGPQDELVLQTGGRVVLNPALAFISVPSTDVVHDQVMRILSDNRAAIIPLDDAFFQNRDEPIQSIQRVLSHYLGQRDLYDSTQPVSGRRFFGRERLLVQLGDALHRGRFLGIYGLRKIGKTSLVYQLRDEQLRDDAVAYVDLQASPTLRTRNCDALYWEVECALHGRLSAANHPLANLFRLGKVERFSSLPEGGTKAPVIFAEDLRAFLDAVVANQAGGIGRVVILLDELEQILPVAGQGGISGYLEFFALLRGLSQTERYQGALSCVVVAANAAISERGYWHGRENPVYALFAPFFIPPLPEGECDEMICSLGKGMSVYWEPEATSAVFSETCGHPFLTRTLCSYIARIQSKRPLRVTRRMVHEHIPPFIRDQGNLMEQITELVKTHFPEEAKVLERIALGESPDDATDETFRHLLSYHLVVAKGGRYRITLNLLRRWLRRRAGL